MLTDDSTLKVALIGYGFAGRTFHAPLLAAVPAVALAVVGSSDPSRVRADLPHARVVTDPIAAATDPDVDLVVIAAPNQAHVPLARAALRAGKHVVIDKPMAPTLAEARELVAEAERHGLLLSVFQNRRWDSDFLAVREAIGSGVIGEATHVESRIERFRPEVRARWREQAGPATGLWWDLGPHLVDQALELLGRPDHVVASLAVQREGGEATDWAHVVLECGERRAVLQAGMLAATPGARFVVHGTRGSLVKQAADRQEAQLVEGLRPGEPGWGEDRDPLWIHEGGTARSMPVASGDQSRYYAAVAAAILGAGGNPVPPRQALDVMAVLEAAQRSADEGRRVAPDYGD